MDGLKGGIKGFFQISGLVIGAVLYYPVYKVKQALNKRKPEKKDDEQT